MRFGHVQAIHSHTGTAASPAHRKFPPGSTSRSIHLWSAVARTIEFETAYPGWYAGRTIHIHLKVYLGGGAESEHYAGGHVTHTGQLFFPEEITAEIAQLDPYVTHGNVHRTLHSEDHVFQSQGGAQSIVQMERLRKDSNAGGFLAAVTLAVDPEATPAPF